MRSIYLLVIIIFYPGLLLGDDFFEALQDFKSKVIERRLDNGLRVLFYKRDTAPIFSAVLTVRVGGTDEQVGQSGLSHMLEHMAFKGSDNIGTKDFSAEQRLLAEVENIEDAPNLSKEVKSQKLEPLYSKLAEIWIDNEYPSRIEALGGVDFNAHTGPDFTTYVVSLPKDSFERWAELEASRIVAPVMRQFYQERSVVLEERFMRNENSPTGKLYEGLLNTAFVLNPYRSPVIGYQNDIEKLRAGDARELHQRYYVGGNMVLALIGDVDPELHMPIIERAFSAIPGNDAPAKKLTQEPPQLGEKVIKVQSNAAAEVLIGYKKPIYPDKDDAVISMLTNVLSGRRSAPLYKILVEEKKIVSALSYNELPGSAYPNLGVFHLVARDGRSSNEILDGFDQALKKIRSQKLMSDEALRIAKKAQRVDFISLMQNDIALAELLTETELLYENGWAAIFDWMQEVDSVNLQQLYAALDRYFVTKNRTVSMLVKGPL